MEARLINHTPNLIRLKEKLKINPLAGILLLRDWNWERKAGIID